MEIRRLNQTFSKYFKNAQNRGDFKIQQSLLSEDYVLGPNRKGAGDISEYKLKGVTLAR